MIDFGMEPGVFREEVRERRAHLQRGATRPDLMCWPELDAVLHQIEPRAPVFALYRGGPVPESRYTDQTLRLGQPRQRLRKRQFYAELRNGATLVINRFEDYSLTAKRLCSVVARFAERQAIGNAYLSIGGDGTFGRHWDTHDVFAIQLMGRKRWRVFAPTFPLPLGMHGSEGSDHRCPSRPVLEVVLEPGDLLYLPRGWWHEAEPLAEPSLHLSVGAYGPTVHDFVQWAAARRLPDADPARLAIDQASPAALGSAIDALREAVLDPACRAEFLAELARREQVSSEFNTALFLQDGAGGLDDSARICLNGTQRLAAGGRALVVNGAELALNPTSSAVVALLVDAPSLTVADIGMRLPQEDRQNLRLALLDLAQHDIVSIECIESTESTESTESIGGLAEIARSH